MTAHRYDIHLAWEGSTGAGAAYTRDHRAAAPPTGPEVHLTADPSFGGDGALLNPEQLLVMAVSSCQMLSFLALAARAGLDVVEYVDEARGTMPTSPKPMSITTVDLAPTIRVAVGTDEELVERLVREAHEQCFIARSLRTRVEIEVTVEAAA